MGLFDRKKKEPEKAKADFSNVQSGASTRPAPSSTTAAQTYTVQPGDSLSKIAQRYYGNASEWPRIHEANRDRIQDPDLIQPGWELTIPPREEKGGQA